MLHMAVFNCKIKTEAVGVAHAKASGVSFINLASI